MKKNNTARIFGRVSVIVCTLMLLAALTVGASAHNFRDVSEYDEAIDLLSSIEVIKGYSNTSFGPNDNVTRWQMALLISKLRTGRVETSVWESTGSATQFPDVKPQSHYPAAINYAHNNGIIIGRVNAQTGAQEFAPDENITVQDGITMCVRALGYPRNSYDSGYPNSYISKGKELGLFEGLYNLSYTAKLTRGQTAQMLYNALFAPTYGGATLADDAFGFVDANIVLAATDNLRFDSNVKYASNGKYTFAIINDYGRLGDSFELDASMFDFDNANDALGTMYSIRATEDFGTILSLDLVSKVLPDTKTASLMVTTNTSNIATGIKMGGYDYKPVSQRTAALETGKVPSTKEILIYALNDDVTSSQYSSGKLLSASNIQGTTGYYTMKAFDDNGDGYADRAFYKAYSFGQYKADSSGRLAIAKNNTASQIKIVDKSGKTTTVTDGSYVLYSFDSQTKTLEIYKVLTEFKDAAIGSAYNATNSTLTVNGVQYQVGSNDVRGAAISTVAKEVTTLTATTSRKLSGYYDTEKRIIFVCKLQGEDISLSGNYYDGTLMMVYGVSNIYAYDTALSGTVTGTPKQYPTVFMNNDQSTPYIINSVNGVTATMTNYGQMLKPGDVVRYTIIGYKSVATQTSWGQTSVSSEPIKVLNLEICNSKASYTTNTNSGFLYIKEKDNTSVTIAMRSAANTTSDEYAFILPTNATIFYFDGRDYPRKITYDEIISETNTEWQWDGEDANLKGFKLPSYCSLYINAYTTTGWSYSMPVATTVYIRPFDFSTYATTTSSYSSIVYVPSTSLNTYTAYDPYSYTSQVYPYYCFDLSTGVSNTTVYLPASKGRLTTPGYYKVLNGYITDVTPVTSSISTSNTSGKNIALSLSPTVSIQFNTYYNAYMIQVGSQTYTIKKENIRIYQISTSTQQFGSSSSQSMNQIPKHPISETNKNEYDTTKYTAMFESYLSIIASGPSMIKAIYTEPIINQYGLMSSDTPFCIII